MRCEIEVSLQNSLEPGGERLKGGDSKGLDSGGELWKVRRLACFCLIGGLLFELECFRSSKAD